MASAKCTSTIQGGDESRLYGGADADIFAVASGAFVEDGTGEDYITWNNIRLSGAVKQAWSESPWAYYGGFSAVLANDNKLLNYHKKLLDVA